MKEYTKKEFIEAIKNSGYLFESEIAQFLTKSNFFVETNTIIIDALTNKSREIDLVARYNDFYKQNDNFRFTSIFQFVFELKNNDYPLVLMTKLEPTPNTILYESLKEARTFEENTKAYDEPELYLDFIYNLDSNIYTQYCSFKEKKSKGKELMAFHPDNLHLDFSKIVQYCDEMIERWETSDSHYNRYILYLPILLLKNDLYELDINTDLEPELKKVDRSKFVYNYHKDGFSISTVIFVVTQKDLKSFLDEMILFSNSYKNQVVKQYNE